MSFESTFTLCLFTSRRTWCSLVSNTAWCRAVFTGRLKTPGTEAIAESLSPSYTHRNTDIAAQSNRNVQPSIASLCLRLRCSWRTVVVPPLSLRAVWRPRFVLAATVLFSVTQGPPKAHLAQSTGPARHLASTQCLQSMDLYAGFVFRVLSNSL